MNDEKIKELLSDRLEGWELAELLELTVNEICVEFKDKVEENLDELKQVLGINEEDDED